MTFLDRFYLGLLWCRGLLPERRRWKKNCPTRKEIRLFYGYDRIATTAHQVFGGLVKLQDLDRHFPNDTNQANILYLISSALPHFPVRMAYLARKSGVKLVVNQNGVAYPGWFGKGWQNCNKPMRDLHSLADYIIYQSEFCKKSADLFVGRPRAKWEILYNPVDTSVFVPSVRKHNNKVTILLAGSHGSFYRPETAIRTLRLVLTSIPEVKLVIAGRFCWHRDPKKAEAQVLSFAKEHGVSDQVDYIGPYTQKQAVDLLQRADLLIHTKYNDPCPRLVVEAMACGLPVVYSATGGVAELVGEEGGIGIAGPLDWEKDHPPSAEELAHAAIRIITDLDNYAKAARNRAVEKFDVLPWLARHQEIFSELLEL